MSEAAEIIAEEDDYLPAVREQPTTSPATLFGVSDPAAVIVRATEAAKPLAEVVRRQGLTVGISGREYCKVEAWTLLGSMLGVFPVTVWTRKLEDGWEARCEARTRQGEIVGAAEAECLRSESRWKTADDYALRAMAQTRATSRALRQPLGFVMQLAGYEATPAEEMPDPAAEDAPSRAHVGAATILGFGKHKAKTIGQVLEQDRGYVEWLASNARDPGIRAAAATALNNDAPAIDPNADIPF